jgi:hypothetical protein
MSTTTDLEKKYSSLYDAYEGACSALAVLIDDPRHFNSSGDPRKDTRERAAAQMVVDDACKALIDMVKTAQSQGFRIDRDGKVHSL